MRIAKWQVINIFESRALPFASVRRSNRITLYAAVLYCARSSAELTPRRLCAWNTNEICLCVCKFKSFRHHFRSGLYKRVFLPPALNQQHLNLLSLRIRGSERGYHTYMASGVHWLLDEASTFPYFSELNTFRCNVINRVVLYKEWNSQYIDTSGLCCSQRSAMNIFLLVVVIFIQFQTRTPTNNCTVCKEPRNIFNHVGALIEIFSW
jgi:hypothetical protein